MCAARAMRRFGVEHVRTPTPSSTDVTNCAPKNMKLHCLLIVIARAAFCPNSPTMSRIPVPPGLFPPGLDPAEYPAPDVLMVGHWMQIVGIANGRQRYILCDVYDHYGWRFRVMFSISSVFSVDLNPRAVI